MAETLLSALERFTSRGVSFEEDDPTSASAVASPVDLIAYYLPQFHAIPENDAWWGNGFTEWTNVTKALPRYEGHYQPRLPADLGFYDLSDSKTLRRQAAMARRYGIETFCFHYYWFSGRRLLEKPLELLLENPDIDIGFCINWANEPWSRRWDGLEKENLVEQAHSPEDDLDFIRALEPLIRDPRYLRVAGRPLIMIYRPGILPDAVATMQRWRSYLTSVGLPDPYLVMAQAFDATDPRKYGLDAAAGFPPHGGGWDAPQIQDELEPFDPRHGCRAVEYRAVAAKLLENNSPSYRLHPGVCPSWDNEARRRAGGFALHGANPADYGVWLEAACLQAMASEPGERLVFINAWNEWAEGAYLEPDRHYGFGYLRETARTFKRIAALPEGSQARAEHLGNLLEALSKPRNARRKRPLASRLRLKIERTLARLGRADV